MLLYFFELTSVFHLRLHRNANICRTPWGHINIHYTHRHVVGRYDTAFWSKVNSRTSLLFSPHHWSITTIWRYSYRKWPINVFNLVSIRLQWLWPTGKGEAWLFETLRISFEEISFRVRPRMPNYCQSTLSFLRHRHCASSK